MGVEEELEALRKQGVTKKNASELKDARGLSTPEAAENAIKAEQKRTRIANYGKEATSINYPNSSSEQNKSTAAAMAMSTANDNDGDESSVPVDVATQSDSKPNSKDITNMIQITNDFAVVGDECVEDESDEGHQDPEDCFFGAPGFGFCPIDAKLVDGATKSVRGALDEHVVPRVDGATRSIKGALDEHTKSIRGALDEHVVPRVNGATQSIKGAIDDHTKSIRGALDEHVVPRVNGATQSIRGAVDDHTKSIRGALDEHVVVRVNGATNSIKGALDEHTKSIRGALDEHVVPNVEKVRRQSNLTVDTFHRKSIVTIDSVKNQSIRTIDSVKNETQRLLGEVQKTSERSVEGVRNHSQVFFDRSKTAIDDVSAQTMAIVHDKVKPGYEILVETSHEAIRSKSEECQSLWSALVVALTVTYAPCYIGTAPGWKSLSTSIATRHGSGNPWYCLLEEASLRALGRVVFCDNPVTGIFIWLGILCASPLAACCALLGVLTANATAIYFDMDQEILRSGQYARNAVLIGTSVVDSFGFDFPVTGNLDSGVSILLFLSVALAPLTLLVESIWIQKVPNSIPSLLLPYNIVLMATVFCAKAWNVAMATQIIFQNPAANIAIVIENTETKPSTFWIHEAVLNGLSRIFFVDGNVFTGLLILIGVLFCSRIIAASLVAGALVSSVALGYLVFEENHWYLDSGYASFNPALCAAGIFFYLVPSWKLTGLALFGIVATTIVQGAVDVVLGIMGVPVSTSLGFCLTFLPLLSVDLGSIFGNREDYFIQTIPESELSTPEDYLKRNEDSSPPDHPTDSCSSNSDEDEEDDVEKNTASPDEGTVEEPPTNEETPLLA